tara:strand:- start:822 stop:1490 length:669 start_codon:yes stop_codon:yes gene_type:complete
MSIILFGKGPSLSRCSRDIVDKHNDIGICNYPVLNNMFISLIENRTIQYHFANCGTFDERYTNEVNKLYNIQKIYNTNKPPNNYKNFLKNFILFSDENIYELYYNKINNTYGFLPSTGIMMLKYIIDTKKYNHITLVGYDLFEKNKDTYYYDVDKYNKKIMYLIEGKDKIISKDGKFLIHSGHDFNKTKEYMEYLFKSNPHIRFDLITNVKFDKIYENVNIL